jgi:hypothetical protein
MTEEESEGPLAGGLPDSASCNQEVLWLCAAAATEQVYPAAEVEIWRKEESEKSNW